MSRPIDADAVKGLIRSGISVDTYADQDYVCELVDDIPTIDAVSEWIPCSERLPKEEGRFLVTVQKEAWDRKYFDIEIAYCSPNHKWFNIANCEVLAWTPLPKPYGREESE